MAAAESSVGRSAAPRHVQKQRIAALAVTLTMGIEVPVVSAFGLIDDSESDYSIAQRGRRSLGGIV